LGRSYREVAAQRRADDSQLHARLAQADLEKLREAKNVSDAEFQKQVAGQNRRLKNLEGKLDAEEQATMKAKAETAASREENQRYQGEIAVLAKRAEEIAAAVREKDTLLVKQSKELEVLTEENGLLLDQVSAMKIAAGRPRDPVVPKTPRGKVVGVQPGWGFTVLNVGDKHGARPNTTMVVARDGNAIGRLKISSVEPNRSIADVVPGTFPRGTSVQLGDEVFAWLEQKNEAPK
jgi:hypothetical protein